MFDKLFALLRIMLICRNSLAERKALIDLRFNLADKKVTAKKARFDNKNAVSLKSNNQGSAIGLSSAFAISMAAAIKKPK